MPIPLPGSPILHTHDCARRMGRSRPRHAETSLPPAMLQIDDALDRPMDVMYRYRLGPPGILEYITGPVEQLLGFRADELYAAPDVFAQIVDQADLAELAACASPSLPVEPRTGCLSRKDGGSVWVEILQIAARDGDGRVTAVDGVMRPVTVAHLLDERLRLVERLEASASLAADLAHKFKEALTGILGYSDLLIVRLAPGSRDLADACAIRDATKRAAALAEQLTNLGGGAKWGPSARATDKPGQAQPTSDAPSPAAASPAAPSPAPALPDTGGDETILLVEDDPNVRHLIAQVLTRLGYRVIEADGPTEALGLAVEQPSIDLVISDVVLPDMTGPDLASALRARLPDVRVMYMSGYPAERIARHGVLEPGVDLLIKPFTPTTLARHVRDRLNAGRRTSGG